MSIQSHTPSILDLLRDREWLDAYKRTLINIIYFGLFLFVGGIYIFPNDSGTQQTFYLLIVLPFLFLFPFVIQELPWKNKYFYSYMAFPLYMFASHFWAEGPNITRGWFFFFKQLVYFATFFFSLYMLSKYKKNLLKMVLYSLLVAGFISVCISLLQYIVSGGHRINNPLAGYSIVDTNKAACIYAIHSGLCISILILKKSVSNFFFLESLFIIFIVLDFLAIYFAGSEGAWYGILFFFLTVSVVKYFDVETKYVLLIGTAIILLLAFISYLYLDELLITKSISVRISLWTESIKQVGQDRLLGIGLVYKHAITVPNSNEPNFHSHNIAIDTFRFSGIVGLLMLFVHTLFPLAKGMSLMSKTKGFSIIVAWLLCGLFYCLIYGQQPFVRPGSYIWYFYWIPLTLLIVLAIHECEQNRNNLA